MNYFDRQKAMELYCQGLSAREVAATFNVPQYVIQNLVNKNNIKRATHPRKSKYGFSVVQLKCMFEKGMTNKEISIVLNISNKYYVARRRYQFNKGEI